MHRPCAGLIEQRNTRLLMLRSPALTAAPLHRPPPPRSPFTLCSYLGLQDVPRTADHAPSRTFYTWRANMDAGIARVASDLYRAAGNLHARLTHELTKQQVRACCLRPSLLLLAAVRCWWHLVAVVWVGGGCGCGCGWGGGGGGGLCWSLLS